MKSKVLLFIFFLCSLNLWTKESNELSDILTNGKWYNDEYSFNFYKNNTFRSFYTLGSKNGVMFGTYEITGDSITLTKKEIKNNYNHLFLDNDKIKLFLVKDSSNPKSFFYLKDENENIKIWSEKTFVKEGALIHLEPGGNCVALGYKLNSTTDYVRIRKGPGVNYDYMDFNYKDLKTTQLKSYPSVFPGTNIRVLARTAEKVQVKEWYNYWYYIEYKEPKKDFLVYKTAWMFGEFINVPENKDRSITITSPENEGAFYGAYSIDIIGKVTGAPVKMKFQVKNSYGNVLSTDPIQDYNQKDGTFSYRVSKDFNNLFIGTNIYNIVAVYSDNKTASKQITLYLHESGGEMAKPVIYLYPEKEREISVKVNPANGISVSDPQYNQGWQVKARPDGTLINLADGKTYPYLFWESSNYKQTDMKEGFVVKKENLRQFFIDKLIFLGLNQKEIQDFNQFWLPKLSKKPYYLISFISQAEFDKKAPLSISPAPDKIIRVFFDSLGLDRPVKVKGQKLKKAERHGYSVIEWGGMNY